MNDDKRPVVVCDMIVEKDGKILMGKRGNVFGKGTWALVGGHMEFNETTKNCVSRELKEEAGITPKKFQLLGVVNDLANLEGQPFQHIRFVFLVTDFDGEIENKEPDRCEGWQWFKKDALPEPIFVGHIKVLKYFLDKNRENVMEG